MSYTTQLAFSLASINV